MTLETFVKLIVEDYRTMIRTPHVKIEIKSNVFVLTMGQDIGILPLYLPTSKHESYSDGVLFG